LSIPYNFIMVRSKEEDSFSEALHPMQAWNVLLAIWNFTIWQSDLVLWIEALKNDIETGMYFDSTIPQGYGVGVAVL
jgi:mevalonate kinase